LRDGHGDLLPDQKVMLEENVSGAWKKVVRMKDSHGTYSATVGRASRAVFRARFVATSGYVGSASGDIVLMPQALLSRPSAPSSIGKGVQFTVNGKLDPKHRSDTLVTVEFLHYNGSTWVTALSRKATVMAGSNRYSTTLSLPSTGSWRIRSIHSDGDHARTVSPTAGVVCN
jgi:hypothetical protein